MANDLLYGVIVILFGAALMYGVYAYFTEQAQPVPTFPAAEAGQQAAAPAAPPACTEYEEQQCTTGSGCDGRMVCIGGQWSGCVRYDAICEPGKESACTFSNSGGCQFGKRACNKCGTGWSGCQ
ncbi:MAG: hypothetical protein WC759_04330 [Candidatus Micrarchaeia archaeon]